MRHIVAAIVAFWLAAMSAAPLAAAAFQSDGPNMACCKRKLKNCCCRKAHGSTPRLTAVASCSDSCSVSPSSSPVAVGLGREASVASRLAPIVLRVQPVVFVAAVHQYRLDLYQRPPPFAV